MPVIINTTNNPIGTPGGEHQLLPGANEVTGELVAFLRTVPYYQTLLRRNVLMVEPDAAEAPPPAQDGELPLSLKGRPAAEVAELIARCEDRALLLRWLSTDGRKATRTALESRAAELEEQHGIAQRPADPIP